MGAKRKTRVPGAVTAVTGTFLILLFVVSLVFGGSNADAQSARKHTRKPAAKAAQTHKQRRHHIHRRAHKRSKYRIFFRGFQTHRTHRPRRPIAHKASTPPLQPVVASWYYDEGNTACGFHAEYGVANKTLPCGTKVTIRYGDREVVATVDDRGPYVYGRDFDLSQTTAAALGMSGVVTVYASTV